MKTTILRAACVAALALGLGAFAADDKANDPAAARQKSTDQMQGQMQDQMKDKSGKAVVNATDQHFLTEAIKSSRDEIRAAKLAEKNGSNVKIRNYGEQLLNDHQKLLNKLEAQAKKLEVTAPKDDSKTVKDDIAKLTDMRGTAFDDEYLRLMISSHQKAIDLFTKEAQDGQNPDLTQLAAKTIPALEDHLKMGKDLQSGGAGKASGRTPAPAPRPSTEPSKTPSPSDTPPPAPSDEPTR